MPFFFLGFFLSQIAETSPLVVRRTFPNYASFGGEIFLFSLLSFLSEDGIQGFVLFPLVHVQVRPARPPLSSSPDEIF